MATSYSTIIYVAESKESLKLQVVEVDTLKDQPNIYVVHAFPSTNEKLQKQLMGWLIVSLQEYSSKINIDSLIKICKDENGMDKHFNIKIQMMMAQHAEHFGLTKIYL